MAQCFVLLSFTAPKNFKSIKNAYLILIIFSHCYLINKKNSGFSCLINIFMTHTVGKWKTAKNGEIKCHRKENLKHFAWGTKEIKRKEKEKQLSEDSASTVKNLIKPSCAILWYIISPDAESLKIRPKHVWYSHFFSSIPYLKKIIIIYPI